MIKVQWVLLKSRFQNIQPHFLDSVCVHTKSNAANKTVCFPFKYNYTAHGPAAMVVGATCDDSVQIYLHLRLSPALLAVCITLQLPITYLSNLTSV